MSADRWWERATPSTWDEWAVADDMAAIRCQRDDEAEQWEMEYERAQAEAYEAWCTVEECLDMASHAMRARRRAFGLTMLVPASWMQTRITSFGALPRINVDNNTRKESSRTT